MNQPNKSSAERIQIADAMTADAWRIAEAARLALAPELPAPWLRGREADAAAHRLAHRELRARHTEPAR